MSRRGATGLMGILPVDKPAGMTSHDVVSAIRRITGEGRVGHAGTLDPMATGLLVVLLGAYTRLAPYLTAAEKAYDATITFGSETDTDDAQGSVTRTAEPPARLTERGFAQSTLDTFLGRSLQTPPAYSAVKVDGQPAYRAARAGRPLALEPREIEVSVATLTGIDVGASSWDVGFVVSKGTYVRVLARAIGLACGSAAHLSALRRTASGAIALSEAHTLDDVASAFSEGHLAALYSEPLAALGLPAIGTSGSAVLSGAALPLPEGSPRPDGSLVAITRDGRLAAIYRVGPASLVPAVVLPGSDVT